MHSYVNERENEGKRGKTRASENAKQKIFIHKIAISFSASFLIRGEDSENKTKRMRIEKNRDDEEDAW